MTALSIPLDKAFQSGACNAMPRSVARAAAMVRRAIGTASVDTIRDYCLTDPTGRSLGTVPSAHGRPTLGAQYPTVFLRRES